MYQKRYFLMIVNLDLEIFIDDRCVWDGMKQVLIIRTSRNGRKEGELMEVLGLKLN